MSEWISIEESLPSENTLFLACDCISKAISLAYYEYDEDGETILTTMALNEQEADSEVTHWMPIPMIPELTYD